VLGIGSAVGVVMFLKRASKPKPPPLPSELNISQPVNVQPAPVGSPSPLDLANIPSPSPGDSPLPERSKHPDKAQPLDQQNPNDPSVNGGSPGPIVAQPTPEVRPSPSPVKTPGTIVSGNGTTPPKPKSTAVKAPNKTDATAENQNKKAKGVGGFFKKLGGILKGDKDKNDKKP
ncbi:MAG: hypothetical protein ACREAC_24455, partial [Blastocatellia bacterium]